MSLRHPELKPAITMAPGMVPRFGVARGHSLLQLHTFVGWGFPELFVISQTALPALLYIPGLQPLRVLIRTSAYAVSLAALFWYRLARPRLWHRHPAEKWLILCVAWLLIMVFHPTTNSLPAGLAQLMLYLAVMAPVFWVPGLKLTSARIQRLLFIILICSGVNSIVGVLQVYDPGRWLPQEFSRVVLESPYALDVMTYVGPDGSRIVRPPGLFDTPGAVAGPATVAAALGLMFCLGPVSLWKKAVALLAAAAGVAAIFLSYVRTSLLIAAGSLLVYIGLLAIQRQKTKAVMLLGIAVVTVVVSFSLAVLLGGEAIQERFSTLSEADPITVYFSAHRGDQLEYGFTTLLRKYPLGAGLGRWGMMRHYFGDENNTDSPLIWAELQPNAWLLDGGWILLLLYSSALMLATRNDIRMARVSRSRGLRFSASAIVAINVGVLALILGFTPFTTQIGLQYWFLAGALHAAGNETGT
jgi:hypothetical protein